MTTEARGWWLLGAVAVLVPIGLASAPRAIVVGTEADRGAGWTGRGWGVVRAEEVGETIVLSGLACSASQTIIAPTVELLADVPPVLGIFGPAAPTRIIELIPEGTRVARDEVICRLDPSAYADRARDQRIEVDRARSGLAEADRALAVAEAGLVSYRDGDRAWFERQMEVDRAMARVDLTRAEDYLAWSGRMGALGYVSSADLAEHRLSLLRAEVALSDAELALRTFRESTVGAVLRGLEAEVDRSRTLRDFAVEELEAAEERLDHLEEQVDRCSIRAPHDGTVYYADIFFNDYYQVREGAEVYPGIHLFILPDLSKMEVELFVHERFAGLVAEGRRATVSFEALPGCTFPARVKSIDLLPTPDWRHFEEWQQFRVRVAIDRPPAGLRPEMTTRVSIATDEPRSALTVPAGAVGWDDAGAHCVVETDQGPNRRAIRVDRGTVDRLVVLEGLRPGDRVLIDPRRNDRGEGH
ncbi:efflux RND transporter periplasmic adaptor subunit [Tautonia plasticadhaerens]|uniref:Macrolide transporter subunit MacA n=1 Tax=Tautonia plasticadhaerens TaxID=2527974 RepID=A0A518H737_9BACT|nr:efflux RND transporter periplasmic adaptor subunit [Tautonia plasticadhaerens]QDV36663.1 macrolide transporter subunit MacA [Tautonia plasticadhaerens]